MPNNFIKNIIENANEQIKYKNTVTTGEITVDNDNGTYDVKIAKADSAIPNVSTNSPDSVFAVGQMVIIGFKNGCKENPVILGRSEELKQTPAEVEVDYSGESGGGVETVTVDIERYLLNFIRCTHVASYNALHDSVDGSDLDEITLDTDGDGAVGQEGGAEGVNDLVIWRIYLFFDTSAIPVGAIITSVTLSIWFDSWTNVTPFNVVIQNGQPSYPHNPIVNSDYDCSKYSNNGGQIDKGDIIADTESQHVIVTLNSNGIAWINKGGITKFCLRSSYDIARVHIVAHQQDGMDITTGDGLPTLTITYTI